MPRWASRITLELVDVRVERVQEITEEDAIAERSQPALLGYAGVSVDYMTDVMSYRDGFADLWDSVYGAGAWERNDWVWVLTFRRLEAKKVAA
jgi:hypothetical protein